MYNFDADSIPELTENTRAAIAATDAALLSNTQMLAAIVETVRRSNLPINITQDLYSSMVEGANRLLEGRAELERSVKTMRHIANNSPHRERMWGCPGDPESEVYPMGRSGAVEREARLKAV